MGRSRAPGTPCSAGSSPSPRPGPGHSPPPARQAGGFRLEEQDGGRSSSPNRLNTTAFDCCESEPTLVSEVHVQRETEHDASFEARPPGPRPQRFSAACLTLQRMRACCPWPPRAPDMAGPHRRLPAMLTSCSWLLERAGSRDQPRNQTKKSQASGQLGTHVPCRPSAGTCSLLPEVCAVVRQLICRTLDRRKC